MTLIDSLKVFYRVYNYLLKKFYGEEISFEKFRELFCKNLLDTCKSYNAEFWSEFKEMYYATSMEEIRPLDGAEDVLQLIRAKGGKAVVLSGRGTDAAKISNELSWVGLLKYIDAVYTLKGQNTERPFDKTFLVKKIKEEHGKGGPCFLVGDYVDDIVAGKKNGCVTIGILGDDCKPKDILAKHGADYVVKNLLELKNLLTKLI